jgi:hypothetical protein
MLPPLPRCSRWVYSSLVSPSRISLPRFHYRVGLHIVLFEVCSAFTHVAACTLARSPIRDRYPGASDISSPPCLPRLLPAGANRRVGLAPTGKRRLVTAHVDSRRWPARPGPTRSRRKRPYRSARVEAIKSTDRQRPSTPGPIVHFAYSVASAPGPRRGPQLPKAAPSMSVFVEAPRPTSEPKQNSR